MFSVSCRGRALCRRDGAGRSATGHGCHDHAGDASLTCRSSPTAVTRPPPGRTRREFSGYKRMSEQQPARHRPCQRPQSFSRSSSTSPSVCFFQLVTLSNTAVHRLGACAHASSFPVQYKDTHSGKNTVAIVHVRRRCVDSSTCARGVHVSEAQY